MGEALGRAAKWRAPFGKKNYIPFAMKTYQHTQSGATMLGSLGAAVLILAIMSIMFHPLIIPMVVIGTAAWMFRSMTVEISNAELTWYFGSGFPRKSVPLSDVASAEVIRTSFLNGWGIHYTPRGWLYNVSGYGAVAVGMKNGKRFCLGTDEPEELARQLNQR